jgi:hypothetical protein
MNPSQFAQRIFIAEPWVIIWALVVVVLLVVRPTQLRLSLGR